MAHHSYLAVKIWMHILIKLMNFVFVLRGKKGLGLFLYCYLHFKIFILAHYV